MQIYEITQKTKVNEINYGQTTAARVPAAVSRGVAVGTGFAGALGNAITNAPLKALGARTGSTLTPDPDAGKERAAISDRMDQAVQAAMPAITQQADQQWRMWSASTADMVKKSGASNMSQVDPAQLKNALMTQITTIGRAYGIPDYKSLPSEVDPKEHGGTAQQEAMDTVADIDAAIAAILNPRQQAGTQARDNWVNLTKLLYSAGLQSKFRERQYSYSSYFSQGAAQQPQQSNQLAQVLASNPQALAQLTRNAQRAGIPPAQLQALGITPQMNVRQPTAQTQPAAQTVPESSKKKSK